MGAGPGFLIKDSLLSGRKESMKQIKSPPSRMANGEVDNLKNIVPLLVSVRYLLGCTWCGIFAIISVEILFGTLFINRCIRGYSQRRVSSPFAFEASGNHYSEDRDKLDIH